MDARTQQQLTVAGATQTRMKPAQLWIEYFARGGVLSQIELEAYLLGVVGLPPVERDILALTLNEILQNTTSQYRVPYSTDAEVTSTNSTGQMISGSLDQAQEIVDQALSDLGAAGVSFLLPGEAEYQRLVAVDQTGLVDTAAEERFDRITRQAQEHFGVSSASVALITDRRQFLKSVVGPLGQNTPRDVALCNETIRRAGPLIINDTLADLRFRDNPLVTGEPRIRFYAGYPIFGTKGWAVGTFCIIDQKPRGFSADDQQELKALAMIIQQEINN
ncbi:GAF domain-containing protein [Arthrobacter sp. CAL618]|uniref:GAF domain-containing protein n=1 Tax=Arthrobacter sp. CAL618 TaxID=1055770 RepID=UPI000403A1FE|nr:GAF domain-containing protein [Arthrobacter sp. CAL618]